MSLLNFFKAKKKGSERQLQLLREQNSEVNISDDTIVKGAKLITIKKGSKINRGVNLLVSQSDEFSGAGKICIGENCLISLDTKLFAGRGEIHIGDHVEIGMNCFISAQKRLQTRDLPATKDSVTTHVTKVGKRSMLSSGCFIVEGTTIGERCIVAAGAVVSGQYGDDLLFVGNPARPLPNKE